jgi:hypothetical protein
MIYHIVPIAHINTLIITIFLTSPFKMWVSSCQATASISFFSSFCSSHVEKTTRDFSGFHHVAKAFMLASSMIPILGIGIALEIQRFSTIL